MKYILLMNNQKIKIMFKIKFILILFFFSFTSCRITSPYLIKSFQQYPKELTKKEFIKLNEEKKQKIFNNQKWKPIKNIEGLISNYNESNFFKLTYYNIEDSTIISSIDVLNTLKYKQWILPPIYQEIYGINGTIWISGDVRDSINKIQKKHLDYLFKNTQLILNNNKSKLLYPIYKKAFRHIN